MSKQKPSHMDELTLQLFDEVKIKPDLYPGYATGDASVQHSYFIIKKYDVELGGHTVPFVDILRHSEQEEIDLHNQAWQYVMAMPRWTKPFILSFPAESVRRVPTLTVRLNKLI